MTGKVDGGMRKLQFSNKIFKVLFPSKSSLVVVYCLARLMLVVCSINIRGKLPAISLLKRYRFPEQLEKDPSEYLIRIRSFFAIRIGISFSVVN